MTMSRSELSFLNPTQPPNLSDMTAEEAWRRGRQDAVNDLAAHFIDVIAELSRARTAARAASAVSAPTCRSTGRPKRTLVTP